MKKKYELLTIEVCRQFHWKPLRYIDYVLPCRNVIHGSDSVENAKKEIALWFPEGVTEWQSSLHSWIYEWNFLMSWAYCLKFGELVTFFFISECCLFYASPSVGLLDFRLWLSSKPLHFRICFPCLPGVGSLMNDYLSGIMSKGYLLLF